MINQAIIHIGTHKTGSTSIQDVLYNNHVTLRDKGIFYPIMDITKWNGHHPIAWQLGVDHPYRDATLDTRAYLDKIIESFTFEKMVLSSEDFEFLGGAGISTLKKWVPAHSYQIVVYFRNFFRYIQSDYQQNVRSYSVRYSGTIQDFFVEFNFYERINYLKTLKRWSSVFSSDSIQVYSFEKVGNVVEHFLKLLKVEGKDTSLHSNVGLNSLNTVVLSMINSMYPDIKESDHSSIVNYLFNKQEKIDHYTLLPDSIRRGVSRNCAAQVKELSEFGLDELDLIGESCFEKEFVDRDHPSVLQRLQELRNFIENKLISNN
ncbi:hypothetical protein ACJJID_01565 [Microbulbifer sp. CnH-101-G]|uniref:hypothetical protein n=1 Tax=Microbulbifer sp. CnH-101-G TaxID=3243393 RepID=UPI00403A3A28